MPNRILRDWTASELVDSLSTGAEVFFTRLIMKADDLGCYHGSSKMLKSTLFPLKSFTEKQVQGWREECKAAGILSYYTIQGREYVQIINFGQRLRQMNSKFPLPPETGEFAEPSNDGQLTDNGRLETKRSRNEVETESEEEGETETKEPADETPPVTVWPSFEDFWEEYGKKVDRPKCEKKWKKISQEAREKILDHVPRYVASTPDVKYRKNPTTYLNNECWNDEIIEHGKRDTKTDNLRSIAESIARTVNGGNGGV